LASSKSFKKREGSGSGAGSENGAGTPSAKVRKIRKRIYLQPELQKCVLSISGIQGFFQGQQGQLNLTGKKTFVSSISVLLGRKVLLYSVRDICTGIRFYS
jgi:hypothetical protein